MITQLTLGNFRSLGAYVQIPLTPLTVLVGANGAGKSNVADALQFVGDAFREGLEPAVASRQGFGSLRRWSRGRPLDVGLVLQGELDGLDWSWGIVLTADEATGFRVKLEVGSVHLTPEAIRLARERGTEVPVADAWRQWLLLAHYSFVEGEWEVPPGPPKHEFTPEPRSLILSEVAKRDPRFQLLVDYFAGLMVYSLSPQTLRDPQRSDPTRPMRRHGENWATHLRALDRETQGAELLAGLGRVAGDIDGYRVSTVGGLLVPELRHGQDGDRDKWFGAGQESDGTLRMAGILTALLQSPSPSLIGIEEPELVVHPSALPLLVDYMKQASTRTQVLITTQSPELLDLVDAGNLRVVERGDEGTTVAEAASTRRERSAIGSLADKPEAADAILRSGTEGRAADRMRSRDR